MKRKKECEEKDPQGLSGYCNTTLDPDDPNYFEDTSESPFTTYFGNKGFGKHPSHPKDWWNHLIKDGQENGNGMNDSKSND